MQVVWRGGDAASSEPVRIRVEGAPGGLLDVEADAAAVGAVDVTGLEPGGKVRITATLPRAGRSPVVLRHDARTLASPPGAEVFRFATVNDVHLGDRAFGLLPKRTEPYVADREPFPLRCLRASVDEALAWGAQALVVKGDLTALSRKPELEQAAEVFAAVPVPVHVLLGNHDTLRGFAFAAKTLASRGIEVADRPTAFDHPGIRVVLLPTISIRHGFGVLEETWADDTAALVAGAGSGAFVAMHHYPQRFRYPMMWPPGVAAPMSSRLLDGIAEANPATLVAAGHSHRHRRHHHGPLTVAEVGSTKDYPGTWAGYVVHEGGVRQVTKRVARPDCIAWTEHTRSTLFGIWGVWAPGVRSHRCFTIDWPTRTDGERPTAATPAG